ncbi:MAG: A/G-specific adenine glycosylase [Alphaproteobacteria bacterium]
MTAPVLIPRRLLAWYDRHGRVLPWRTTPAARRAGRRPDPYVVWLSEIMLQQTTVAAVGPYFRAFISRWPDVHALAAAGLDEVLTAWAGLGYYARARNLHRCAGVVSKDHGGVFPESVAELRRLPGIGPYTAAAIAAIAYDRSEPVVDGNVERVLARLFAVEEPLPGAKGRLAALAAELTPRRRPGDYAQALMDLGATVCTPRQPRCGVCPLAGACVGRRRGLAAALPARAARADRPTRHGTAYWAVRADGAVLLRRRPERGLLGGMMEVPSSDWLAGDVRPAARGAPFAAQWRSLPGTVRHSFSHFHLELRVVSAIAPPEAAPQGVWVLPDRLSGYALPSVMRKVVRHALLHTTSATRA